MKSCILTVLTVIASFVFAGVPASAVPLFSDDFNDGDAAGWAPASNSNFSVTGNAFSATGTGNNYVYLSIHSGNYGDYSYSARLIRGQAADGNFGGLVLRYQDNQNYYLFAVNEAGYCWFAKNTGGAIGPLMDWTSHSFLRPDTNDVTVSCAGNVFRIYANGRYITTCSDPDTPHPAGSIGFFVHNDMELTLDDVIVDTPAATGTDVLPFTDDFDDGDDLGWYRRRIGGTFAVTGGEYIITGEGQGYLYGSHADGPFDDFSYEVDVTRTAGASTVPYGISFRGQKDSYHSSYLFAVSGAQQYTLAKTADGTWTPVKDWTLHSAVTGTADRLKVRCDGSSFTLYVNGTELGTHTDASYTSGTVGLFVSGDVSAGFDNVSVMSLSASVADRGAAMPGVPRLSAGPSPFDGHLAVSASGTVSAGPVRIYRPDGRFVTALDLADGTARWAGTTAGGSDAGYGLFVIMTQEGDAVRVLRRPQPR